MFGDVIIIGLLLTVLLQRQVSLATLKRIEGKMSTQEERLQALLAKTTAIQAGVDKLQAEFDAFKANNPDLEDELSGLETAIGALDADVNPPEEPTV